MDYCIDGDEPKVEKAILHLFKNQLFTDVTVKYNPGNTQFHVHKLILALYSPVLCDNFYGKSECDTVNIESSELSAVENMIKFCYGETPVFRHISDIKETKVIAEKYKIVQLLNICIKEIGTVKVNTSNVLTVLEMSMQCGNKKKENECLEFISCNRETVFASELFMKMKFEIVNQIFEKLREMSFLTEVQYLRSAIKWMRCDDSESKEKLMKIIEITKLSMDEFVDIIISFPSFFTNTEIAKAFKKIKETIKDTSTKEQSDNFTGSESIVKVARADDPFSVKIRDISNQKLTISILDGSEGDKQAVITFEDKNFRRGLTFNITEDLMDGMFLQLLSHGNGDYVFNNVTDVTYDGVYFLLKYLKSGNQIDYQQTALSPLNYIDVSKVAFHFGLQKVRESCLKKLSDVIDFDPEFLDGLALYPVFREKVKTLIISHTMDIILHPNFVNCSGNLMNIILSQRKLSLLSEFQLLVATILWLEARNRLRWRLRSRVLDGIAFENVSSTDLEYVSNHYPNFFTKDEIDSILLYKMSNSYKNSASLPSWYNFKSRKY